MTPTKRSHGQDQLGRSGSPFPIRLLSLTLFAVIVGSAWPISARSLDPAYDSHPEGADLLAPALVPMSEEVVSVTAGQSLTCVLTESGRPQCFGRNDEYQLGTSSGGSRAEPAPVDTSVRFSSLSAGLAHVCGLTPAGRMYCWGFNRERQLGQDDTYPGESQPRPVPVGERSDWVQVSAGQAHTCAIRDDGALFCWGRNKQGQCGLGADARIQIGAPAFVGEDYRQVSAGQSHTCAVKRDGTLWCWGDNPSSQLGLGDQLERLRPTRLDVDPTRFDEVSANTFGGCALDTDRQLWCWGRNVEGQLGLGDNEDRETPTLVEPGVRWRAIAVSRLHLLALRDDGVLLATGKGLLGRLGTGSVDDASELAAVAFP